MISHGDRAGANVGSSQFIREESQSMIVALDSICSAQTEGVTMSRTVGEIRADSRLLMEKIRDGQTSPTEACQILTAYIDDICGQFESLAEEVARLNDRMSRPEPRPGFGHR